MQTVRRQDDRGEQRPEQPDHPIVGWIGLVAIAATIVLLIWARVAVIGTGDIEEALVAPPQQESGGAAQQPVPAQDVDGAVTSSRWATGFSP